MLLIEPVYTQHKCTKRNRNTKKTLKHIPGLKNPITLLLQITDIHLDVNCELDDSPIQLNCKLTLFKLQSLHCYENIS